MAEFAAQFRREIPDLVKRPPGTEFEHIILAGPAEIFRRPIVVESQCQFVVEEAAADAGLNLDIAEVATGIEGAWIGVVSDGKVEAPFAHGWGKTHVIVELKRAALDDAVQLVVNGLPVGFAPIGKNCRHAPAPMHPRERRAG